MLLVVCISICWAVLMDFEATGPRPRPPEDPWLEGRGSGVGNKGQPAAAPPSGPTPELMLRDEDELGVREKRIFEAEKPREKRQRGGEVAFDELVLVQVTPAIPADGVQRAQSYNTLGMKMNSFHPGTFWAVNTIVPDFALGAESNMSQGKEGGVVDSRNYAILIPYSSVCDRVLNFWPFDTVVVGDVDLAKAGAVVFYREGAKPKFDEGVHIKQVAYGDEGKRTAVARYIAENGYATLINVERTTLFGRASVRYRFTSGEVELGSGPGWEQSFKRLNTKSPKLSFGPCNALLVPNGATESLAALAFS